MMEGDLWNSGFQCPNSSSSLEFIKPKQLELTLDNRLSDFYSLFLQVSWTAAHLNYY